MTQPTTKFKLWYEATRGNDIGFYMGPERFAQYLVNKDLISINQRGFVCIKDHARLFQAIHTLSSYSPLEHFWLYLKRHVSP